MVGHCSDIESKSFQGNERKCGLITWPKPAAMNPSKTLNTNMWHIGKGGLFAVNATPLFDKDGLFIGYLGRTTDISQLVLAKVKVDRANAKLEAQTFELEAAKRSAEAIRSCSRTSDISGRLRKNTIEESSALPITECIKPNTKAAIKSSCHPYKAVLDVKTYKNRVYFTFIKGASSCPINA